MDSSDAAKISVPMVMAMPPTRNGGRCRFGGVGQDTDRHTGLSGGIQREIRKKEKLKSRCLKVQDDTLEFTVQTQTCLDLNHND